MARARERKAHLLLGDARHAVCDASPCRPAVATCTCKHWLRHLGPQTEAVTTGRPQRLIGTAKILIKEGFFLTQLESVSFLLRMY